MPEYYNLTDWHGRGDVIITPIPKWRRNRILNLLFPYRIGDIVEFHVHTDTPKPENAYDPQAIYEYFGSGLPTNAGSAERTDFDFKGSPIRFTGDVDYSIGNLFSGYSDMIFHANVESRDQALAKKLTFAIGALVTLACVVIASLLRLIRIDPILQLFVKP